MVDVNQSHAENTAETNKETSKTIIIHIRRASATRAALYEVVQRAISPGTATGPPSKNMPVVLVKVRVRTTDTESTKQ